MSILRTAALVSVVALTLGCSKKVKMTADAIEKSTAAISQQGDRGTSAWIVGPDGLVTASLKGMDGKPIAGPVTGQVTFTPPNGTPTSVPVEYDPKAGVLTATGPKLDADITPVTYALTADGNPWSGSIDVPRTGTQELADNAKLQATLPPNTQGPNGGVVQMVGPDRVEVVANKNNGEVRAYLLDPNNKPMDPGDRKITLSLQSEQPEVVVLEADPQAHFVIGHVRTRVDPIHVTIAVNAHGTTHACLVGWAPGAVVVVGPAAPRVHLLAVEAWPGETVIEVHGKHHHHEHEEVIVGAPGVVVAAPGVYVGGPTVVVGAPGVMVGGPGHVNVHENIHVGGGHRH